MAEMKTYYECDPSKHTQCKKTSCKMYGGPCHSTTHLEYAQQPVKKVRLVFPVTRRDMEEMGLKQPTLEEDDMNRESGLFEQD